MVRKVKYLKAIYGLSITFAIIVYASCNRTPAFPPEPRILSVTVNKTTINTGIDTDTLKVIFEFTDGDGDIGRPENDTVPDVFITDDRTGYTYEYRLPQVDQLRAQRGIKATAIIDIIGIISCRPFRNFDTTSFSVQIRDRAGNMSNIEKTPQIILNCN